MTQGVVAVCGNRISTCQIIVWESEVSLLADRTPLEAVPYVNVSYWKRCDKNLSASSPDEATHVMLYAAGHYPEWTFKWPEERPWAEKLMEFLEKAYRRGRNDFKRDLLILIGAEPRS